MAVVALLLATDTALASKLKQRSKDSYQISNNEQLLLDISQDLYQSTELSEQDRHYFVR